MAVTRTVNITGGSVVVDDPLEGMPPWTPHNPAFDGLDLPDGRPDWLARVQSCVRAFNRVLFTQMFPVVPTAARQRLVPRPGETWEGIGRGTGLVVPDNDPFVNSQPRFWLIGPVETSDRADDVVFKNFDIDLGLQENHNTTLNAISVVGSRALVDDLWVRRPRAGNLHEAFVVKAVSQDQNVDAREWELAGPADHATVRNCRFTDAQDNNEQDEDETRAEVPELTLVWADTANDNVFQIDRNARQIAPVHPVAVNAHNATEAHGNVSTGKGVPTVVYQQQPKVNRWRNPEIYNNRILP